MSIPLKTLAVRWPNPATAAASNASALIRRAASHPKTTASFATSTRPSTSTRPARLTRASPVRQPCSKVQLLLVRPFTRAESNLAGSKPPGATATNSQHQNLHQNLNQNPQQVSDLAADARAAATAAAATAAHPVGGSGGDGLPLDWNTFFQLRTRRRRIQLLFSAVSSAGGILLGAGLLSSGLAEPLMSQVPLDPFLTLGLLVFVSGALGWLAGPSIGGQVFYLRNWRFKAQIQQKEAEFFARVKRNRVDPSNSSAGNPGMFFSLSYCWRSPPPPPPAPSSAPV